MHADGQIQRRQVAASPRPGRPRTAETRQRCPGLGARLAAAGLRRFPGHREQSLFASVELSLGRLSSGNRDRARSARAKAVACYLAYRRDGGENHNANGRISLAVTEKLRVGDVEGAASFLGELSVHPQPPDSLRPFIAALQAIAAGSRDPSLAEGPELDYTSAAELLHLIDVLEAEAGAEPAASR